MVVQDLAPITLYSDWGIEGGVSTVWDKFQGAGSGRAAGGLMPPMQCKEVGTHPSVDILEWCTAVCTQLWYFLVWI